MTDYAVAENQEKGGLELHRADCPYVRLLAASGAPVLTMFGCRKKLGDEWPRHACLNEEER